MINIDDNELGKLTREYKEHTQGTCHKMSRKHLPRHVRDCHNIREPDAIDQLKAVASDMVGKRLNHEEPIIQGNT